MWATTWLHAVLPVVAEHGFPTLPVLPIDRIHEPDARFGGPMAWKLDAFSTYDKRTPLLFVDDSAGVVCRLTTGAHGGPLDVIVPREMYGLTTRDRNAIRAWATRQLRAQSRATVASMESLDDDTDDTGP